MMPMANSDEDRRVDALDYAAAGNYSTDWLSRREELQEMYELERTGQSVVWQDPQDRIAIMQAIQNDLLAIIASGMNPGGGVITGDATSSGSGIQAPHDQPSNDVDTMHLINLIDNEGEGGTVLWVDPQHRDLAINARLALFRSTAMGDACNTGEVESEAWPELQPFSPQHVQQQDPVTFHRDTHADGTSELATGEGFHPPNAVAIGIHYDILFEPIGPADVQGDATLASSVFLDGTGTISPDQTSVILPTVRNVEPCNYLNDFALDARRLRGLPQ